MVDAYSAGTAFSDLLRKAAPLASYVNPVTAPQNIGGAIGDAVGPSIGNFLRGAVGANPQFPNSVTMALPPATPVSATVATAAPTGPAPIPANLGKLSPAAAAVLGAPTKAAATDPLAGLSFRQLLSLAQTGQAEQRSAPKPTTAVDQAGQVLSAMYSRNFQNDLKNAGSDPAKQAAAYDAFEKKMLPIALKGNTADAAIFDGPTPGAQ